MEKKDEFVRLRKILSRRHLSTIKKIHSTSSRVVAYQVTEDKDELRRLEGEKRGLCYALKALDKACQTEMGLLHE